MALIIRSNQQPPLLHGSSSQICLLHSPIMKGSPLSAAFQQTCKECNANLARDVDLIRFCLDISYSVSRREVERERERGERTGLAGMTLVDLRTWQSPLKTGAAICVDRAASQLRMQKLYYFRRAQNGATPGPREDGIVRLAEGRFLARRDPGKEKTGGEISARHM